METRYTASEKEIRIISEEEAVQLKRTWSFMLQKKLEPWGGLFLYESKNRRHPKRSIWIAIDDSSGECFIKEFKRKEKAIEWLIHPAGPKLVRL